MISHSATGEHGDSQFVAWSASTVAGTPLLSLPQMATVDRVKMANDVRTKAYAIIQAKGSTFYGIGGCVAQIVKAVLNDTHQVMPVSHFVEELGTCISVPAIVGSSGILGTLIPPLSEEERSALETSAMEIKGIADRYVL